MNQKVTKHKSNTRISPAFHFWFVYIFEKNVGFIMHELHINHHIEPYKKTREFFGDIDYRRLKVTAKSHLPRQKRAPENLGAEHSINV